MSIINVYKCDHTGKLFEDKEKYKKHLSKLAKERKIRRKIEIEESTAKAWWLEAQNTEMSLEELECFIILNQDKFWAEAAKADAYSWKDVGKSRRRGIAMPVPLLAEFTMFNLRWTDYVSNSHSCPFNGVRNWSGTDKSKPMSYPGWSGRVEWKIKWPEEFAGCYPGSDLFDGYLCGIHTGGGGGGGMKDGYQHFGYEVKIYAEDWPGLARWHEKQKVWNLISNTDKHDEFV